MKDGKTYETGDRPGMLSSKKEEKIEGGGGSLESFRTH